MMIGSIKSAPDVEVFGFDFCSRWSGDFSLVVGACKVMTESDIASSSLLASVSSVFVESVSTNRGTSVVAVPRRACGVLSRTSEMVVSGSDEAGEVESGVDVLDDDLRF